MTKSLLSIKSFSGLARRIDAATPPHRDRSVDALRALAILGVVLGHWLVTAIYHSGQGVLRGASPLQHMPWLTPLSWAFQTLAVFFFVGGHVGAKSYVSARAGGVGYGRWLRKRLARLFRPVAMVLGIWAVASGIMLATGVDVQTLRTLLTLVLSPLWFLMVFAVVTALTPLVARLSPVWPVGVVVVVDLGRFALGWPGWCGWVNVAAGWLVPYTLGAAWARGRLNTPRCGLLLLVGGTLGCAALVTWGGYPASMVGVPGARVSNLNPPTIAAVAFGVAQCGLALMAREPLRRLMARPAAWAAVALANMSAMTIFLWHQTAMLMVTTTGLSLGSLPGLHNMPDSAGWVAARLGWLPVFALALTLCWVAFRSCEQARKVPAKKGARVIRASLPDQATARCEQNPPQRLSAAAGKDTGRTAA
ncbi:acyltransferase family protein [Streptomyces klenkii]|uniref:acyltransferase family protein n=1 Tax=Streptomyces klenkii TaxID=1420899 RepID=UPI003423C8D0